MKEHQDINQTLNHLFRQESGKMVSVLIKIFGTENLELAEDVVQDALTSALESWKFNGIPKNPRAWLYKTAKNKAIDIIRRKKHSLNFDFSDPKIQLLTSGYTSSIAMENFWQEKYINDDFLGMMYACCHHDISPDNQITFILKSLSGFSTKEIAKAFLTTEATISKRLYRTKEFFRKNKIRPQIPDKSELIERTGAILKAIYLMFNEGYNSTHSDDLIRNDLISQAMYLCECLLNHEKTKLPEVNAFMALMCFHAARSKSRLTPEGGLVLLSEQDRSKWDQNLIESGNSYMNKAASGDRITSYHLEAAIAYEHATAASFEETNWPSILGYYDSLLKLNYDPIVFLNRCLVILEMRGPENALRELEQVKSDQNLKNYYLYHASMGEIFRRLGENSKSVKSFNRALELTQSLQEKNLLNKKLNTIFSP